jgi:hypothetical protein
MYQADRVTFNLQPRTKMDTSEGKNTARRPKVL